MTDSVGILRAHTRMGVGLGALLSLVACAAMAQQPPVPPPAQDVSAFLGTWCAQGDPAKQTSIAAGGISAPFLDLTNEDGNTSYGQLQGPDRIVAPQRQFVVGTLSRDGSQINWSNGSMWARCPTGGGWPGHFPRLAGTWLAHGDHSRTCSIRQRGGDLDLRNEVGQSARGSFVDRRVITTDWDGTMIQGRISHDGNRIDWSNGTFWIRDVVYSQ